MKRLTAIILSLVMATIVFSACSGNSIVKNQESVSETAVATEETNIYDMENYENSEVFGFVPVTRTTLWLSKV